MTAGANDTPSMAIIRRHLGDIEWRLDNLYFIKDKYGEIIKFVRNESQMELWENRHFLNIILKDRQRGFSTFIAILIFDTCFFSSNQECGIIDITLPDGKKKLGKIKLAFERLPADLKKENPLTTNAKETLEWKNGSSVYIGTSHRVRGITPGIWLLWHSADSCFHTTRIASHDAAKHHFLSAHLRSLVPRLPEKPVAPAGSFTENNIMPHEKNRSPRIRT